jgi:hypothetical protein
LLKALKIAGIVRVNALHPIRQQIKPVIADIASATARGFKTRRGLVTME